MAANKHMDLDDRIKIEEGLNARLTMKEIAASVGKDPTTISKEIKKHRTDQPHSSFNEHWNKCAIRFDCHKKHICGTYAPVCKKECKQCRMCNSKCPEFIKVSFHCTKLDRAPYACNGCKDKHKCRLDKAYYRASTAQRTYRTILVESRTGINMTKDELDRLDEIVSPLIKKGQSPYTILANHPEIALSEKSLYNYIESGALSVGNIDLPKKVKYKSRHVHKTEIKNKEVFVGRCFKDFEDFIHENPDTRVVEMDTVVGSEGSHKVLLTLHFESCHFMTAFLLPTKEAKHVEATFDAMEQKISSILFLTTFPVILTDRGGEFEHADALECGVENTLRTNIYYCDPMASWQKPHCEKNHEYIRKIAPKGTSFDPFTQDDIDLMMSHINSAPRESLGGLTPYHLASMMLPKDVMDYFNLTEIAPDEVNLTPSLLKDRIAAR